MRSSLLISVLAVWLAAGCRTALDATDGDPAQPEHALDWTLGEWRGVRRDAGDGSEAEMVMRVERILDGAGQTRAMEIVHDGGVYRGFAVQVFDSERGVWVRSYVNDVRRSFAALEGETEGERSVWRSSAPNPTRRTRLVEERPAPDRWLRTMSISTDGEVWSVLWVDDLRR